MRFGNNQRLRGLVCSKLPFDSLSSGVFSSPSDAGALAREVPDPPGRSEAMAPSSFSSSDAMFELALSGDCDEPDRGCAWRTLLSDPVRERAGVAGGVPMFARALREFMLRSRPCTDRRRMAK